ncbi:MAG: hypothetical protein ACEPOZ_01225 [Marinifilaceae bacterium]
MDKLRLFLMLLVVAVVAACSSGSDGDDDGMIPNPNPSPNVDFAVREQTKTSAHPQFGAGSNHGYTIDGIEGKELTLARGTTYIFDVNTPGHPFYISTSLIGQGAGEVTEGVTNSKTTNGTLSFTPNGNHPDLLYYQCDVHDNMGWKINIVDP